MSSYTSYRRCWALRLHQCLVCNQLILVESRWSRCFHRKQNFLVVEEVKIQQHLIKIMFELVFLWITVDLGSKGQTLHVICDLSLIYNIVLRSDGRKAGINTAELRYSLCWDFESLETDGINIDTRADENEINLIGRIIPHAFEVLALSFLIM